MAEAADGSWKLYRLTDRLETLRQGTGDLQSVSDEVVVIREGEVMKVESLDGKGLGSFSVPLEKGCHRSAEFLGSNRLYLNDCKSERIVDLNGMTLSQLHPPKGCCSFRNRWSSDGKRLLFDYTDRKVFVLHNVGDIVRTLTTLGMSGEEWPNREEVRVIDPVSGESCFEWRRSFAKEGEVVSGSSAAISPSGEFVAIAAENKLSIYRLPAVCEPSSTIKRNK